MLIALCGRKTLEIWNVEKKHMIQRKEFKGNVFEVVPMDKERIMIATRNEGCVLKYVNKPLLMLKHTEQQHP